MTRIVLLVLLVFVHALVPLVFIRALWAAIANPPRAWNILLAYDRLGNAALNDDTVETISARAAKARDTGKHWGCVLCRVLDWLDKNHCDKAKET